MGIRPVTEADHQPGATTPPGFCPVESKTCGTHHGRVSSDIDAMNPRGRKDSTEIGDRRKILIAGAADQLDPAPLFKSEFRR